MSEKRFALIIANDKYEDEKLGRLITPSQDAISFAELLSDANVGGFEIETLLNQPHYITNRAIEDFFSDREREDLLLLYFSGHGVKDAEGELYFASPDTSYRRLRTTSIPATLVNDIMKFSRSRRQLMILDCCYSGAFAKGMVAKAGNPLGASIGTYDRFGGRGRIVLTASDAMQYAFEGEMIEGEAHHSVFTKAILQGIRTGNADLNKDGFISADELYEYVRLEVGEKNLGQEPRFWAFDVKGKIYIANNPNPLADIPELPPDLQSLIRSSLPWVRKDAVRELEYLLYSNKPEMSVQAHIGLQYLMMDEKNQEIFALAASVLGVYLLRQMQQYWLGNIADQVFEEHPQSIHNLNLFIELGVDNGLPEEKNMFIKQLNSVLFEDFLESGMVQMLTADQIDQFKELTSKVNQFTDGDINPIFLGVLGKFIPNLEAVIIGQCEGMKVDMLHERIEGMKEFYSKNENALEVISQAENARDQNMWHSVAEILNTLSK